jgi:putative effector of murein hydrolase LrgA (UPF0299 family)
MYILFTLVSLKWCRCGFVLMLMVMGRFVVPEGVSVEELKRAALPEGVRCDVKEA